ncbi:hypothetical protein J6590_082610 [Homalodisca vitripennis]|nr:hypothetical protein J6590_082610 [Homalodisca vitripennis]
MGEEPQCNGLPHLKLLFCKCNGDCCNCSDTSINRRPIEEEDVSVYEEEEPLLLPSPLALKMEKIHKSNGVPRRFRIRFLLAKTSTTINERNTYSGCEYFRAI